jgi:acyl carrier protein
MSRKQKRRSIREPFEAPATPIEQTIARMCSSILGTDRVGKSDHFFTKLGGNSLQAMWLLTMIQETFAVTVPVESVFNQPTVAQLAQVIAQLQPASQKSPGTPEGFVPDKPLLRDR